MKYSVAELDLFLKRINELIESGQLQFITPKDEADNKVLLVESIGVATKVATGLHAILIRIKKENEV